jgi:hypothetical protein
LTVLLAESIEDGIKERRGVRAKGQEQGKWKEFEDAVFSEVMK